MEFTIVGVSKNDLGGAGAQCSCKLATDVESVVISRLLTPMVRIWPFSLIECASKKTTPRSAEVALFRSIIPVAFLQMNARSPDVVVEFPTTSPKLLIANAQLEL